MLSGSQPACRAAHPEAVPARGDPKPHEKQRHNLIVFLLPKCLSLSFSGQKQHNPCVDMADVWLMRKQCSDASSLSTGQWRVQGVLGIQDAEQMGVPEHCPGLLSLLQT